MTGVAPIPPRLTPYAGLCLLLSGWASDLRPANAAQATGPATRPATPATQPPEPEAKEAATPLVTDRPDFTESTVTVPRQRVQLEGGYTFTYDREGNRRLKDHTFPELLLRIGLVEDAELRLGWVGYSFTENLFRERNDVGRRVLRSDHDDSGTDMNVGFKFHLLDQDRLLPDFAVLVGANLPTGGAAKSTGDVDPEVKLAWGYALTEKLSLAGNVNFAGPTSQNDRFFQTAASISLAYAWTEWLGSYVEYFGFYPNDRGSDAAHFLNGGLTFPVTDDLQFDLRAGFGLNEEADDFFAGVGMAIRF